LSAEFVRTFHYINRDLCSTVLTHLNDLMLIYLNWFVAFVI